MSTQTSIQLGMIDSIKPIHYIWQWLLFFVQGKMHRADSIYDRITTCSAQKEHSFTKPSKLIVKLKESGKKSAKGKSKTIQMCE